MSTIIPTPVPVVNQSQKTKHSDDQLIEAYKRLGSVWRVGRELGMCGQSVHQRLAAVGATTPIRILTDAEKELIREAYRIGFRRGDGILDDLALRCGRTKQFICRHAGLMGLTNMHRGRNESLNKKHSELVRACFAANGHPRGMLGKQHSEATKFLISMHSKARAAAMTKEQRSEMDMKSLKTRVARGSLAVNRKRGTWKAEWVEIGGKRFFARSRWEANVGRYLQFLKERGEIKEWEHEPQVFWFENIRRGTRSYLPDFKVWPASGADPYFIEVKGWMDPKSRTKLKRMKKYYPAVTVELWDTKRYRALERTCKGIVSGWQ